MKQSLFLFFIFFTLGTANAQLALKDDCATCPKQRVSYQKTDIKIYPNPATNFIEFQNPQDKVKRVVVYNLVGRPIRKMAATSGKNWYDVSDLSRGMYLIQLLDAKGTVITTKRINKR
ncbi:MAG: T9SS type A sorting domain-containing protein [Bacteroidota bacterium]